LSAQSLRLRLLLLAALLVATAVLLAGVALLLMFSSHLERRIAADLEANLNRAVALIEADAASPALRAPLADPRYALPLSGLYWQLEDIDTGLSARSQSLVDAVLVAPPDQSGLVEIIGPDSQMLLAIQRDVQFPREAGMPRRFRVIVAEDRDVIDRSIAAFGREMSLALLLLALVLTLVGFLQVHLGLRPLEAVRLRLREVRLGKAERLDGRFPEEVVPIVREVNDLLDARDQSLAFARSRAADLAHGLKTPLAVLTQTAKRLRDEGDTAAADTFDTLSREMSERIDYQLRLARLRLRPASHVMTASLADTVKRIVNVLRRTADGEALDWQVDVAPGLTVDLDPQDLMELVGVVLENAAQWAVACVRISATGADGMVEMQVHDDGPGLTPEQIAVLGQRGQRLDESSRGTGFGMAIAGEILALNKGEMILERSDAGGLAVRMVLPSSDREAASRA
jgi:signal transduction histidine kinase